MVLPLAIALLLAISCGAPGAPAGGRSAARPAGHTQPLRADQSLGSGPAAAPSPAAAAETAHSGLRVRVPSLGIDLPIVEGDGWTPPLYKAAHYPGTKWPGEGGLSFIYAHAQPGMFAALRQARVGLGVEIAEPSGSVRSYVIKDYTDAWPVTDTSLLKPAAHEELVLYTCTSWTYSDPKIVAMAVPVG